MLMPVLIAQALSSCSLIDEPEEALEERNVAVSIAFTVAQSAKPQTRMADKVLQINSQPYRGIQDVRIIPFALSNPENGVQSTDNPKVFAISGLPGTDGYSYDKTSIASPSWFYYYNKCSFMTGTNAALFYGRAIPESGGEAVNGSIIPHFPVNMAPANTYFELEQMYTESSAPSDANDIATYLTRIARATDWSTTTDSKLRAFYLNFIGQGNLGNYALMAGSKTSVTAYVNDLKEKISALDDSDIKTAILAAIDAGSVTVNYPASLGLPDGAAALKWDNEAMVDNAKGGFVAQTVTTTEAAINSITRFVYPAELYYFGNSRLLTSNEDVSNTVYNSSSTWNEVLSKYPYTSPVSGNTKAVAMEDPIQYAVARLQMTLEEPPTSLTLKDAKNTTVTYSQTKMPLKGIIIGGQHQVGFDFKPLEPEEGMSADFDLRFVYDSQVSGTEANTLVLQSHLNEKVNIILEFENNTGSAFMGKDGIIYNGTKFYLIGEIDPTSKTDVSADKRRVFTQDQTTLVTMKFIENSLKNAYNVVPDLMSPRLEIGVKLVSKWVQTEPTNVPLD